MDLGYLVQDLLCGIYVAFDLFHQILDCRKTHLGTEPLCELDRQIVPVQIALKAQQIGLYTGFAIVKCGADTNVGHGPVPRILKVSQGGVCAVGRYNEIGMDGHVGRWVSEISSALAKSGVNINYIYATACECKGDCSCYAIIGAPDLQRVEAVWDSVVQ